jgi:hypothetical protein
VVCSKDCKSDSAVKNTFHLAIMLSAMLLPALAWPSETIRDICINAVTGPHPLNRGILTPGLAQQAFVQRCNGSWMRVTAGRGAD